VWKAPSTRVDRRVRVALVVAAAVATLLSSLAAAEARLSRAPTQLQLTKVTRGSLSLSWRHPKGDRDIRARYGLYVGGTRVGTTRQTRHTFRGLDCGTTYTLGVDRYDRGGNRSVARTVTASSGACTQPPADTSSPSAPSGLRQTDATPTSVSLAWNESGDNVGVAGYDASLNETVVGTTTSASFTFGNLACSMTYTLGVDSFDAAGNRSSSAVTASTAACVTTTPARDTTARLTEVAAATRPPPIGSAAISFRAEADARVEEAAPTRNFGTSSTLRADGGADPDVESYLRFTVGGLAGLVQNATLRVYASSSTVDGPRIYATETGWSETGIVWNRRPPRKGLAIADKGGIRSGTWVAYDVTPAVTGAGKYSFVLVPTSSDGVDFYSRETARPPELVVTTMGSADSHPPTAPTNLTQTATTETSIALSWAASIDNVGITGYGLYRDGTRITTSAATSHTFAGLACDRSYTFGVDAVDAAGNRSTTALLTAKTAACSTPTPAPTRHVYAGQDLAAAINAAASGETIVVHAGTYARTTIAKQFSSMTFVTAAPGESVRVQGIRLDGAAFLSFSGLQIASTSSSVESVILYGSAHDIEIRGNRIAGGRFGVYVLRKVGSPWASNIHIHDNEISGSYIDLIQVVGARNMTIDHNHLHDPQVNTSHNDGIQVIAADGMTISRNRIRFATYNGTGGPNQGIILGRADPYDAALYVNAIRVVANLIEHWQGTPIVLAGTSNVAVANNTAYDSGQNATGWAFNMSAKNNALQFDNVNVEVWNNIFNHMTVGNGSRPPAYCGFNLIWPGGTANCGASLLVADPQFVDRANYDLRPTSPALYSGTSRPGTPLYDVDGAVFGTAPSRGARGS
jgi:chitodextrinase